MIKDTVNKIFFIKNHIFNSRENRFVYIVILSSLVSSLVEVIGLGMIFPTIGIIISDEFVNKYPYFDFLNTLIANISKEKLLLYFFLIIIFIYLIKFLILLLNKYLNAKLIFDLNKKISSRIFSTYLNYNYEKLINKSPSEMIRNIVDQSTSFSMGFIVSILNIFLETFVLSFIIIFLLFFEFKITFFIILALTIFSVFYFSFFKKKISNIGYERVEIERQRFKYILDGLNGIKEIILFAKKIFFSNQLKNKNDDYGKVGIKQTVYQALPPLFFELITILIFSILVIFLIFFRYSSEDIILILTLYGLAVFRLLPSFARMVVNLQNMSYHFPSVKNVFKVISSNIKISEKNITINPNDNINFKNYIHFKNLNFEYQNKKKIFSNINLTIRKNSKVGIVGESGSGKSTLISLLMGLIYPTKGNIMIDEKILNSKNSMFWQKKIGYVSQDTFLLEDSFLNNIAFGVSDEKIDKEKVKKSAKTARIHDFIISTNDGYNSNCGDRGARISSGQKQRIGLARAIYIDPEVFIFDESTNSLDKFTEKEILDDIFGNLHERTIVFISHKVDLINKYCEEIYSVENNLISKIK